jgi:putative transcriptional regulator
MGNQVISQRKESEMPVRLRLGEILRERDLTQAEFADMCGLTRQTVSTLVNQPAMIRLSTIDAICESLNIEPKDLIVRVRIEPIN